MSDSRAVRPCPDCGSTNCDVAVQAIDGEIAVAVHYCHDCRYSKSFDSLEDAMHAWLFIEDGKVRGVSANDVFRLDGYR